MQPEDITRLVAVGEPRLSPGGTSVAYVVTRVDEAANRYRSAIWLAAADGTRPRQLTAGQHRDSTPVWSPDGGAVGFARAIKPEPGDRGDTRYALCVTPVGSAGETVTLTERDEPVLQPVWSPDGRWLAFASRVRDERYQPEEEAARPPRRVDRLFPRLDSVGWTIDRPTHLHLAAADASAPPRQLTRGPYDHTGPAWSPDGRSLAFVAALHPDADLDVVNDVWVLDPFAPEPAPEPRRLTETDASYEEPAWSPDGRSLACLRTPAGIGYRHARVAVLDPAGDREPEILTADLDLNCGAYPGPRNLGWDGACLHFAVEDGGRVHVRRLAENQAGTEVVVGGDRMVTGYDARDGVVAYTVTTRSQPPELHLRDAAGERRLTTHQEAFVAACPPLPVERFSAASEDGTKLDAWVVRPEPAERPPGERLPALLIVHGGPATQYGDRWFDEVQLLASAGYVVVYANPHGSSGYTEPFGRAIISPRSPEDPGTGWGGIDFRDLMAVLDAAIERYDVIDPERLGILGGSYGGYMTSWAVGHTDRFSAACSERAVNNLQSLEWSSDAAGYFRFVVGVGHLDDPEEYLRMSPISSVRDIRTPLLILHSENDLRCPVEQADCLWVALRLLGRDVEYYRFPAESHELSRAGSPRHRIQRADLILDYFHRKLPPPAPAITYT